MLFKIYINKSLIISKGYRGPASHLLSNPLIFFSTDNFWESCTHGLRGINHCKCQLRKIGSVPNWFLVLWACAEVSSQTHWPSLDRNKTNHFYFQTKQDEDIEEEIPEQTFLRATSMYAHFACCRVFLRCTCVHAEARKTKNDWAYWKFRLRSPLNCVNVQNPKRHVFRTAVLLLFLTGSFIFTSWSEQISNVSCAAEKWTKTESIWIHM